jgi:hypothetical protein
MYSFCITYFLKHSGNLIFEGLIAAPQVILVIHANDRKAIVSEIGERSVQFGQFIQVESIEIDRVGELVFLRPVTAM